MSVEMAPLSVTEPGPVKQAGVLQQNRVFLDFFWDLAKPEQEVRLQAVQNLIRYLKTSDQVREERGGEWISRRSVINEAVGYVTAEQLIYSVWFILSVIWICEYYKYNVCLRDGVEYLKYSFIVLQYLSKCICYILTLWRVYYYSHVSLVSILMYFIDPVCTAVYISSIVLQKQIMFIYIQVKCN